VPPREYTSQTFFLAPHKIANPAGSFRRVFGETRRGRGEGERAGKSAGQRKVAVEPARYAEARIVVRCFDLEMLQQL
jgi:hypothetical protein